MIMQNIENKILVKKQYKRLMPTIIIFGGCPLNFN